MKIINATPHEVNVHIGSNVVNFESKFNARCKQESYCVGNIAHGEDYVPITETNFGQVEGLPEPEEGVYYIVSRLVMDALKNQRSDLLVPNDIIRNEKNQIVGCGSLARN